MSVLRLLPIGNVDVSLVAELQEELGAEFDRRCETLPGTLDAEFAYHPERQQYHSTEILARMHSFCAADSWRVLGVTSVDLYIPILTFVFGEAQVGHGCAVVSLHRLRQEFYGLPPNPGLLRERLLKEAVHELGHTLGLKHCEDYSCVMAPSHTVEWIDIKGARFCPACKTHLRTR